VRLGTCDRELPLSGMAPGWVHATRKGCLDEPDAFEHPGGDRNVTRRPGVRVARKGNLRVTEAEPVGSAGLDQMAEIGAP
jgi:hypothetical protein